MTGYQNEELRQMTYMPLVHPDHRKFVEERFVKALNGTPQSYESKGIHKDGTEYHVYVTNLPIIVDGKIEGVYGIAQDITARVQAKNKLQDSLKEKKTLLAEIHHRVKNNLAIISGLLELQADGLDENELKYDLKNTQSRIHSMAIVHEILYNSKSLSSITMPDYVMDLTRSIRQTINIDMDINFEYDVDDVDLDITQAIPCGLLMNEMVVNSFKYAFEDREQGTIGITMKREQQIVVLRVYDDGIGLPEHIDVETSTSLGLKLIDTLTKQLNGTLEIDRSSGTEFTIKFSIKEKKFLQTA
jgi:two-component sensor histidine kinase